ncbi:MAG: hypothetical protein HY821_12275 [Acidobacteria bacterium]|nr:hypothetical protein [Acidobacteriota bacterium]
MSSPSSRLFCTSLLAAARLAQTPITHSAPGGVTASCAAGVRIPGGAYASVDSRQENRFRSPGFYSDSIALCPKLWSTSPAAIGYDISAGRLPNSPAAFEANSCPKGGSARRDAASEIAVFQLSMNARGTSGTYSPPSLPEAIRKGLRLARQDTTISHALSANVPPLQMVFWMRELTKLVLLDSILGQQDRIGNIGFTQHWYWAAAGAVQRRPAASAKSLPPDIAPFHPLFIRRTWLNDNDAGVRGSYAGFAQQTHMLDAVAHLSATPTANSRSSPGISPPAANSTTTSLPVIISPRGRSA